MGKPKERREGSFPSPSSSSSSDFEFSISLSPSSGRSSTNLCPADELFYKGLLLPLHLSPRISMVRTLLLASSSISSSSTDTTTTESRAGSSSSSSSSPAELMLLLPECDSSRPSSVMEEDARRTVSGKRNKYFSSLANRLSLVFLSRGGGKKDLDFQMTAPSASAAAPSVSGKRMNPSAKQVIKKYVKKVKPLYEKLHPSQNKCQSQNNKKKTFLFSIRRRRDMTLIGNCSVTESMKKVEEDEGREFYPHSHSFSGNLRFPRRKKCAGSCPSSMRSSPTHSGSPSFGGGMAGCSMDHFPSLVSQSSSSMEELQSAIQAAIAHCKSSMIQSKETKKATTTTSLSSQNVTCVN